MVMTREIREWAYKGSVVPRWCLFLYAHKTESTQLSAGTRGGGGVCVIHRLHRLFIVKKFSVSNPLAYYLINASSESWLKRCFFFTQMSGGIRHWALN